MYTQENLLCIHKLFDMTVTQTALWGSDSWNLTMAEKRLLKTTFHAMLRRIVESTRGAMGRLDQASHPKGMLGSKEGTNPFLAADPY